MSLLTKTSRVLFFVILLASGISYIHGRQFRYINNFSDEEELITWGKANLTGDVLELSTDALDERINKIKSIARNSYFNEREVFERILEDIQSQIEYTKKKLGRKDVSSLFTSFVYAGGCIALLGLTYVMYKKLYANPRKEIDAIFQDFQERGVKVVHRPHEWISNRHILKAVVPDNFSDEGIYYVDRQLKRLANLFNKLEKNTEPTWFLGALGVSASALSGLNAVKCLYTYLFPPYEAYYKKYCLIKERIELALQSVQ